MNEAQETWWIIECTSTQERRCVALLRDLGYPGGWYPIKEQDARPRGKAARQRAQARRTQGALVPGYVFVPSEDIEPHAINNHEGTAWLRVFCIASKPRSVTGAEMAQMRQTPERVRELIDEAERQRREAWEAKRPKIGIAGIVRADGPFHGMSGVVDDIENGTVKIDLRLIGPVSLPEAHVERVE